MKKTLKKLISLIAVAATLATSSVVALADNDYMSYSNDFSNADTVLVTDNINGNSAQRGEIVMAVENGVLKATRTRYDNQDGGGRSNSAKAVIDLPKTISKDSKVQATFDFTMNGTENQCLLFSFDGYQLDNTGLAIYKYGAKVLYPSGSSFSSVSYYSTDKTQWIEDGKTYKATVTLDTTKAVYTAKFVKAEDPTQTKTVTIYIGDNWGSNTKGDITAVSFRSRRDVDYGTGVITVDNLSVDAYTETNYELNSIYRSNNGLETNKVVGTREYTFKGLALSKLTNFVDANASFITAAYDGEGRMIDADVKAVSSVDSTPAMPTVEGDTVKSFVLDMATANPLMPVYLHGSAAEPATTMRKVDFEDGFGLASVNMNSTWGQLANIDTYETYYHTDWPGVSYTKVAEGDNNVLKIERATFKSGSDYYKYDTANSTWQTEAEPGNNHFVVKFDKASDKTKITFKFKFEGSENASQTQYIDVIKGESARLIISRSKDGVGNVQYGFGTGSATGCEWTDMKAGEWYTFTADMTPSGFTCSVAGNFNSGYAVKTGSNANVAASADYIKIGSPRDLDIVSKSLAEIKTPTSVWYIDDVVVEY